MAQAMLGQWEDAAKDLHLASKLDYDEEISAVLKKVSYYISLPNACFVPFVVFPVMSNFKMMEAMETIYEMIDIQMQYNITCYILFSMHMKCLIFSYN
jgi:hypothetical protein